jgi:hypothetical protein
MWKSDHLPNPPKKKLFLRRKRLPDSLVWGEGLGSDDVVAKVERSNAISLLTATEAKMIRGLADETAFFLDPDQQAVTVELPSLERTEYNVERYCRKIPDPEFGLPYLKEPEHQVQILVARRIVNNKVVREWEVDREDVPLWHLINMGCLGSSEWRSKFAEHI